MIKVGLIGLGGMGRGHLNVYRALAAAGSDIQLVAVCDIIPARMEGADLVTGNLPTGDDAPDMSIYDKYTDWRELAARDDLDFIDIVLPTYLHAEVAIAAMEAGRNVICEKPMALNVEQCEAMIDASRRTGKLLMIGQCLRFWPAYEYLKDAVVSGEYGKVVSAYFFRGGATPLWSYENWLMDTARGGGVLLDQHVHDIDMVNYLFGMPQSVATRAQVDPRFGCYGAVSTHYYYDDGKVVCAEDDWLMAESFGFSMLFRVNFEKGTMLLNADGSFVVYPAEGTAFKPELSDQSAYQREIVAFAAAVKGNAAAIARIAPESTRDTIAIAHAEQESADAGGAIIAL